MKKYNEFVKDSLNEGTEELAAKYKQEAIDHATKIISTLQGMDKSSYHYECKNFARQLEDIADSVELYAERMDNYPQEQNSVSAY